MTTCYLCLLGPEHVDEELVFDESDRTDPPRYAHPMCLDARDAREARATRKAMQRKITHLDWIELPFPLTYPQATSVLAGLIVVVALIVVLFR